MKLSKSVLFLAVLVFFTGSVIAQTINVGTLYGGSISNEINREISGMDLKLEDSGKFGGLYLQSINPAKYQWNVFLYGSDEVNSSSLLGVHSIVDFYPCGSSEQSKFVLGAGFEYIRMETAMDEYEGLTDFTLEQNIYAPFLRTGNYFYLNAGKFKFSLLPWIGFEGDSVKGDIYFDLPPNPSPFVPTNVDTFTNSTIFYGIAGLNFKIKYHHFVDLKLKYSKKKDLGADEYPETASAMLNIYFTRNLGVSYRFKYMESSEMTNVYNIGGLIYSF